MDAAVINQLNQLNQRFYQTIGNSFNQTRQTPWVGWQQLLPEIDILSEPLTVLDIGCGNGRFGEFLVDNFSEKVVDYLGIDQDVHLLQRAQSRLWPSNFTANFEQLDLIELIRQPNQRQKLFTETNHSRPTLITLFGMMHHLPSWELRHQLFHQLAQFLPPDGFLIFSAWQFATDLRYQNRFIAPGKVNLTATQLEKNDYILDWQRNTTAYRYCHFMNQTEAEALIRQSGFQIVRQFLADGKSQQLNKYYICKVQSNL